MRQLARTEKELDKLMGKHDLGAIFVLWFFAVRPLALRMKLGMGRVCPGMYAPQVACKVAPIEQFIK